MKVFPLQETHIFAQICLTGNGKVKILMNPGAAAICGMKFLDDDFGSGSGGCYFNKNKFTFQNCHF